MSYLNLSPTSPRRLRRAACGRLQRGFSLLEALVSVVVLSFGLLGVAGLQASSLKYSRDARNQSVAVNLAREMAEMIRSNARISGIPDGDKNPYLIGNKVSLGTAPAPAATVGPFTGADKDAIAKALAEAQVADWKYRVSQALPGAVASVCLDSEPYRTTGISGNDDYKGTPKAWDDGCDDEGNIIAIKIGWERENTGGELQAATDALPYVVLPVTPAGQE